MVEKDFLPPAGNCHIKCLCNVQGYGTKESADGRTYISLGDCKRIAEGWNWRICPCQDVHHLDQSQLDWRVVILLRKWSRGDKTLLYVQRANGKYVRRSQSRYRCKNCILKVALCHEPPCFELFHTRYDYKAAYECHLTQQEN